MGEGRGALPPRSAHNAPWLRRQQRLRRQLLRLGGGAGGADPGARRPDELHVGSLVRRDPEPRALDCDPFLGGARRCNECATWIGELHGVSGHFMTLRDTRVCGDCRRPSLKFQQSIVVNGSASVGLLIFQSTLPALGPVGSFSSSTARRLLSGRLRRRSRSSRRSRMPTASTPRHLGPARRWPPVTMS